MLLQVVDAWVSFGERRDLRASELASKLNLTSQELDKLNRELGGFYGQGWESSTVANSVITAGDILWKAILKTGSKYSQKEAN